MALIRNLSLVGLLLFFFSENAHAWGVLNYLNSDWKKATLLTAVKNQHSIRYCVDMAIDSPFNPDSVAIQTEAALRLWLNPFPEFQTLPIHRTACDQQVNLVVSFNHFPTDVVSDQSVKYTDHYYSLVRVNLDYVFLTQERKYFWQDILKFIPSDLAQLPSVLRSLSDQRQTISTFGSEHGINITEAFLLTYKNFIHEFGHAFGLCDTYASEVQRCDPHFSSVNQPSSVMRDAQSFYLTDDDVEGIRQLFKNF